MKIKKILLVFGLILTSVCFASCDSIKEKNNDIVYDDIEAEYKSEAFPGQIRTHSYTYSDSYFLDNSYDTDLAKASFALASATKFFRGNKNDDDNFKEVLGQIGFSNFYANDYLFEETNIYGIGLQFASKEANLDGVNKTIVAVSVRGFDYYYEWVSNFIIGKENDHAGFRAASIEFLLELDEYVSNLENKDIILWISGYSRGGAVANIGSAYLDNYINYKKTNEWLIDDYEPDLSFDLDFDELFCYTFEAPKGAIKENADKLKDVTKNIHNIINECDIVPMVLPAELGFTEYGNIYTYLLDPATDKFNGIGKDLDIDYDIKINEYSISLTKIEGVEPIISFGIFDLYPNKHNTEIKSKDFLSGLVKDLVASFETREKYSSIVDPILDELATKFRNLDKTQKNLFIETLKKEFKGSNFLSFVNSSGVKNIIKKSYEAVNLTISDKVYECIDSLYSILRSIILSELSLSSDNLLKRAATFYMNMDLLIVNHMPGFSAEFVQLL